MVSKTKVDRNYESAIGNIIINLIIAVLSRILQTPFKLILHFTKNERNYIIKWGIDEDRNLIQLIENWQPGDL